jgi:hypothetical protein
MTLDSAYFAKAVPIARLLIEASRGDFSCIPDSYSEHLYHEYEDGTISLLPSLSKFEVDDFLENWEIDEAIELISQVEPEFWPDVEDIEKVNVGGLLKLDEEGASDSDHLNYIEDNLGASEKTQKVLKGVIESVFGTGIESIRDRANNYPSPRNNFLQDKDGTFVGTFKFGGLRFLFEVAPTEKGWVCTYRLDEKSLDSLEKPDGTQKEKRTFRNRTVRIKRWR